MDDLFIKEIKKRIDKGENFESISRFEGISVKNLELAFGNYMRQAMEKREAKKAKKEASKRQ